MEPGKSRTLGGVVKPKFTPKAQARTVAPAAKPSPVSSSSHQSSGGGTSSTGGRGRGGRHSNGEGRGGRGGRGAPREQPQGTIFFSGAAPGTHAGYTPAMSIGPSSDVVIKRERSDGTGSSGSGGVKPEPGQRDASSPLVLPGEDDGDARVRRQLDLGLDSASRTPYHPLAPVTLPLRCDPPGEAPLPFAVCSLGTDTEEEQVARRAAEEQGDIFLFQLPSTLQLPSASSSTAPSAAAPTAEEGEKFILRPMGANAHLISSTAPVERDGVHSLYEPNQITRLAAGRVGKLQIMKSGKVFLVLDARPGEAPLRHQINMGVRANFAQTLVAVAPGEAAAEGAHAVDNMYVLGDVTKKLVITPEFAI